jgi:hypothetical protein
MVDAATSPTSKKAKKSFALSALNVHYAFLVYPKIAGRYKHIKKYAITISALKSIFFMPSTLAAELFASISSK